MDNHTLRDSNTGAVFTVPGLGIGEFLTREYSFALNYDLCVVSYSYIILYVCMAGQI